MSDDRSRDRDYMDAVDEIERLQRLAYIGEHHDPSNTYKFLLDDLVPKYRQQERELAEARGLLAGCQPYVTLAVDNEYDGDKELVDGVAAFLAATAKEGER
jgi:hypothetical protein